MLLQTLRKCIFTVAFVAFCECANRRVANRTVSGAATQISAKLIVQLILRPNIAAVVTFEQRHDESRCAITALGPVAFDHLLLDRVKELWLADAAVPLGQNPFRVLVWLPSNPG